MNLLKTALLIICLSVPAFAQTEGERQRAVDDIHQIISQNIADDGRIFMANSPDLTKRIVNRVPYWLNKKGRRRPLDYGKGYGDGFPYEGVKTPLLLYGFGADDIEFWFQAYHIDAKKQKIENELNYLSFGIDRSLNQSIVFGVQATYEVSKTENRNIRFNMNDEPVAWDRDGWVITPYLVGQSNSGGLFEAKVSYGKGEVNLQRGQQNLETEKFLASLKFARDIYADAIIFTPSLQYIYFTDEQEKHNIQFGEIGEEIEFSETVINRVNLGLGLTQEFETRDKSIMATFFNLNLFYDHISRTIVKLPEEERLTARAELGIDFQSTKGINWNLSGHYDIYNEDDDITSYGGTANLSVRF